MIGNYYIGGNQVQKLMLGSTMVWQNNVIPVDDFLLSGATRIVLPNPPFNKIGNTYDTGGTWEYDVLNMEMTGDGFIALRYEADSGGGFYLREDNNTSGNFVGFYIDEGVVNWEDSGAQAATRLQPTAGQYLVFRKESGIVSLSVTDDGITFTEITDNYGFRGSYIYAGFGTIGTTKIYDPQGRGLTNMI